MSPGERSSSPDGGLPDPVDWAASPADGGLGALEPAELPPGESRWRLQAADDAAVDLIAWRGAPGPVVLTIAAVHGDEYEGPTALGRLATRLAGEPPRGTVLLVPVLNEPACFQRTRCGPDGLNLARVFPGDPHGSTTAQLAASLTALMARCDALIDLHAAGTFYTLRPWAGYATQVAPAVLAQQRQMAHAFGLDLVWGTPMLPGRSLSAAADLGVPAIYVEMTGSGLCRADDVAACEAGVWRVLQSLGLLAGLPDGPPATFVRESIDLDEGHLQIDHPSPVRGLFHPAVALWERVAEGQVLGEVSRPDGRRLATIRACRGGRVAMVRTAPPTGAGESLAVIIPFEEP